LVQHLNVLANCDGIHSVRWAGAGVGGWSGGRKKILLTG